ncbi:hypothetical protein [Staphylococcus haemolyticus]|uniref:hypothetical protein n=1 Tax=Staphylococcus haemolyticus TaxID=1283 RepID=UPI00051CFE34|nr:hypothetical protein [Staphylococcus haemolyticus]KGJ25365.1 hypothetical protein ES24_09790 [Staphylococcus haemolyticus]KGJ29249.1 hypothetical protein ES23_05715 [Staphylococcus haemolyticus]MCH4326205.1 hypothetical protein [Staphylococcus haemolyticus]MCH4414270.1 hypothetical protein [Staphylococcus haemolyticus]MCH4419079.1 hypothetical protein [Staphylococcus haemolyticus]
MIDTGLKDAEGNSIRIGDIMVESYRGNMGVVISRNGKYLLSLACGKEPLEDYIQSHTVVSNICYSQHIGG